MQNIILSHSGIEKVSELLSSKMSSPQVSGPVRNSGKLKDIELYSSFHIYLEVSGIIIKFEQF